MQTQQTTNTPRIRRGRAYRGICSVCGSRVKPSAGVLIGDRANGYDLRCAADAPSDASTSAPAATPAAVSPPATFQGIPVITAHTYPEVSDRAMQAAIALFVRSDADGNAEAMRIARELVAAVAYARGEPMPTLGTVGDRVDDRPRYQAAAAAMVDAILGGSSGDPDTSDPQVTAAVVDLHIDRANALAAAERTERLAASKARARAVVAAPAKAPRAKRAAASSDNPFAHRIKR